MLTERRYSTVGIELIGDVYTFHEDFLTRDRVLKWARDFLSTPELMAGRQSIVIGLRFSLTSTGKHILSDLWPRVSTREFAVDGAPWQIVALQLKSISGTDLRCGHLLMVHLREINLATLALETGSL